MDARTEGRRDGGTEGWRDGGWTHRHTPIRMDTGMDRCVDTWMYSWMERRAELVLRRLTYSQVALSGKF